MTESAIDRTCEKYGCAKVWLDPKLHIFDDCFPGKIRMGDLDGSAERNGFIVWLEWKRGAVLAQFEDVHKAQWRQAVAFTQNSRKQTFVFVLGDPVAMTVDAFRVVYAGRWQGEWERTGLDGLKGFLRRWASYAESQGRAA